MKNESASFLGVRISRGHSTFSKNRHGRFQESNVFQQLFEEVVNRCMEAGLVDGPSRVPLYTLTRGCGSTGPVVGWLEHCMLPGVDVRYRSGRKVKMEIPAKNFK